MPVYNLNCDAIGSITAILDSLAILSTGKHLILTKNHHSGYTCNVERKPMRVYSLDSSNDDDNNSGFLFKAITKPMMKLTTKLTTKQTIQKHLKNVLVDSPAVPPSVTKQATKKSGSQGIQ